MAMPEEEARKLAAKTDKLLVRLDSDQARELIAELRQARDSILAQLAIAKASPEPLTWESYRAQELMRQIDIVIADLSQRLSNVILLYPERATTIADNYSRDMLQVRVVGSFAVVNRPALVALQTYNLELVKKVTDDLRSEIRSVVMQGIIQGQGIPQIARQLTTGTALQQGTFAKVETRARVIARTETIRAFTQGVMYQFEQHGVTRVQWLTAHDERVCQWCGPLDGQVFLRMRMPGPPPLHPQCRCFVRAVIATDEEEGRQLDKLAVDNIRREQKRLSERRRKKKGA